MQVQCDKLIRVVILTQYFPPETGAPQNRLSDLAFRLQREGAEVNVLTAMPSYPGNKIYKGYESKWYLLENDNGLEIHRAWIYVSKKSGIFFRLLNYFSFVFSALFVGLLKTGKVDLIICESPPLFLGFTAVLLKYFKKSKLVFNVSDLWPESALKLGIVKNRVLVRMSYGLENWIYRHSDFISGQTRGIVSAITVRHPFKPIFWYPNGVDPDLINASTTDLSWRESQGFLESDYLVYFGGLLGYAQGLDVILDAAHTTRSNTAIKYVLVGDGPERSRIQAEIDKRILKNVFLLPAVARASIASIIRQIDVAVIPLKKIDLFKGAIPSKIFEILYLEKPILLGVEGEARTLFIEEAGAGLGFEPENGEDLAARVLFLKENPLQGKEMGSRGKYYVAAHFNKGAIFERFWKFIQSSW